MEETTLTEEPVEQEAGEQPLTPDTLDDAAEVTTDETHPEQGVETVEAEAETDEDLEWAKKAGIDPNDPEAVKKLAKIARDNQRAVRSQGKLKESMREATTTDDELVNTVRQLQVSQTVRDFYDSHPDARNLDEQMAEIVTTKPYLAGDLEAVYALVKLGAGEKQVEEAVTKAREATKAEIARSSAAKSPSGNANVATPSTHDPALAAFDEAF